MRRCAPEKGFTVIELLAVVGIIGLVAAFAVPATTSTLADLRLRGDARGVHNMVGLAKMRAAARFTRTRVYVDLSTNNFKMQRWDKSDSEWDDDGGTVRLSDGVQFGFGTLSTPPANTQSTLAMAPACMTGLSSGTIANTACIVFNSRGIPVDASGSPTGANALYLTDGTTTYGVTLSATPLIRLWWTPAASANWKHR